MLFSSIPFLYWFLPCVVLLYFAAPRGLKNTALLLSSLFFYGWGEPVYVLWMLLAIAAAYLSGLLIEHFRGTLRLARAFLVLSVSFSLAMLGYFKYADFFIRNFNAATGLSVPLLKIALPIGISFYTFQILSYLADVYRGTVRAQKNFIDLAAYVALFPQLIAGPIVRYSDIAEQLKERRHTLEKTTAGMRRFILGLGKKVLIANLLGELCSVFRESNDKSVLFFWFYAAAYALHVYFDFSGYSDMAIGLGRIFGFDFRENFNYPFISKSMTEFWRRWHMSLGSWFRDYVYIPLGGNRVSAPRHLFNILVVWMLTGFWHGAAWNFVIWGLYFAGLLILEKIWLLKYLEGKPVIGHLYVTAAAAVSFVIFDAPDLQQAFSYLKAMFGGSGYPLLSPEFLYYFRSYLLVFVIAMIGATPLPAKLCGRIRQTAAGEHVLTIAEPLALIALLLICTAFLVDGSYNPFLYFRF